MPTSAEERFAVDTSVAVAAVDATHAAHQDCRHAVQDLRLTGTPSVFVGGLKVGDYASMDEYLRLMRLSDALGAE